MDSSADMEICRRIAQIRLEVAGARGKSLFAKQIGISPSTYDYYEAARVPPADILLKIADIAGVDLRWLITGQAAKASALPMDHPILQRAAKMLSQLPDSARPLAAFMDLLEKSLQFPAKGEPSIAPIDHEYVAPTEISRHPQAEKSPLASPAKPERSREGTTQHAANQPLHPSSDSAASSIPILGRSAAGVPHFWSDASQERGLTTLGELIARHASSARDVKPAVWSEGGSDQSVQIVTLREPDADDVVEFISSPALKSQFPDAFAVRIDGDSMSPDIRHGDLVILSPAADARDGRPAVVQLRRQVGVTCKIFRREGQSVFLVPINETYPTYQAPVREVAWALRVLARIRP